MRLTNLFARRCATALFILQLTTLSAWATEPVKITELSYPEWLSREPSSLVGEFERSCQTVAAYLQSLGKDFSAEKCVGDLFGAAVFISNSNGYVDQNFKADSQTAAARDEILAKYQQVVDEVVKKAIAEGKGKTEKENADLIFTIIHTIDRDIVKNYLQTVYAEDQEAVKNNLYLASKENEKRLTREGIYQEIYKKLEE